MIQTLYGLKCDGCDRGTSIVSASIKSLVESEVENGPWEARPGGKHVYPACALDMKPPLVRKPKPGVKVKGVTA